LILPGISGAFILLMIGMYGNVIGLYERPGLRWLPRCGRIAGSTRL